ncbi:MetQ/NlpA family ABC transporter substrate-binding protein [Klebsiella pneumoniae]|nr:MetQ/NlpA family ABC transporter substrate-binding protein [Klebsiella pneumoniae]
MVDANGFALSTTVPVFQWAFGIYSDRYSSVQALPSGATIVVLSDGANQGQACGCFQRIGVDLARPGGGAAHSELKNIVGNPHRFVFKSWIC